MRVSVFFLSFSRSGHFEKIPFDKNTVRSCYHIREYDVFRLGHVSVCFLFLRRRSRRRRGIRGDSNKGGRLTYPRNIFPLICNSSPHDPLEHPPKGNQKQLLSQLTTLNTRRPATTTTTTSYSLPSISSYLMIGQSPSHDMEMNRDC